MRALYVNHTAFVSGGERSLLDLLARLPDDVDATLACPHGRLAAKADELGIRVAEVPEAAPSFRLDPVRTTRGLAGLARSGAAIRKLARRTDADLVHANSVRAGLACAAAGRPVVVHVRDALPDGRVADLTRRAIGASARMVLANSAYTAASLARPWFRPEIRVVHNGVDLEVFDPARVDRAETRVRFGLQPDEPALGVVAQITPWKSQDDAIRILASLRASGLPARLLLAGEPVFAGGGETFDNRAFEQSLHELTRDLGVSGAVSFLGTVDEVPALLRALDVLLVPSWQEPFGRSVVEAMAMGLPVIATDAGGTTEIVTDGVDGLLRPPRSPEVWADAARDLLEHPDLGERIGRAARATAVERFSLPRHVQAVLDAYQAVLSRRSRR